MKLLLAVVFVAGVVTAVQGHLFKHKGGHILKKFSHQLHHELKHELHHQLHHELKHELKKLEKITPRVQTTDNGCQCIDYNCGCCGRIVVKKVEFDETICVNASYLPKEYGIRVTLTLNDLTLLNQSISAKNPPPLCAGIPHVKELSVCIRFYNLSVGNFSFSGCVDLEAHVLHFIEEKYDLGCFKVGDGPKLSGNQKSKKLDQQRQVKGSVKSNDSALFDKMRYLNRGQIDII